MAAYYNEFDPKAAAWLRELIKEGHIADGEVDTRSIVDVRAEDLGGFDQCHFFAGIGGWSCALRLAGWPDDKPVWTGSCPCQPFSVAGKGKGTDDERHLWPEFHRLIAECHPAIVFGEQVASRAGREWFAAVRADLEDVGYACGGADLCAAGCGAPHIRQRLYWGAARMANAGCERRRENAGGSSGDEEAHGRTRRDGSQPDSDHQLAGDGADGGMANAMPAGWSEGRPGAGSRPSASGSASCGLAHSDGRDAGAEGLQCGGQQRQQPQDGGIGGVENPMHSERWSVNVNGQDGCDGQDSGRKEAHGIAGARSQVCRLADMHGHRCDQAGECQPEAGHDGLVGNGAIGGVADAERNGQHRSGQRGAPGRREFADGRFGSNRPGTDHGGWNAPDWLHCRDGKWRPVEPGTFPLAHGLPARVGRLRGYGNAIVPQCAEAFIRSFV